MLTIQRHRDARVFLARAEQWLVAREIENGVALSIAHQARIDDSRWEKPVYWATVEDGGAIVGCAFRTPPYRMGVTALPDGAVDALVADTAAVYSGLPGVAGPEPVASGFAAAWCRPRGLSSAVVACQRLHALSASPGPRTRPAGALRLALPGDDALARSWGAAFIGELGIRHIDAAFFEQLIRARQLYFWDDGAPRCMAATVRQSPTAAAIGILYAPEVLRGQGYATATVAALSQSLLDRGLRECHLYADPANAAANAIAERVGYRPLHDAVDIDFA